MKKIGFWNNKGGTGKTSLIFQAACVYAQQHPSKNILVLDLCPQANLSELLLGGLMGNGSLHLSNLQNENPRRTIGGYFELRLPSPFINPKFDPEHYICRPQEKNTKIPRNISLLAGDPLLELQSNAIATLSNTQLPNQNTWLNVIDWLSDFLTKTSGYETIFVDTNPSFSMYTQIALASIDELVLPVMADDSSRRAIQNAFALVYGLQMPSQIYTGHSFSSKLQQAGRSLPKISLIAKNRLTQYMGPASAYDAVMREIQTLVTNTIRTNQDFFTFNSIEQGFVNIRDFQTTGVVAFTKGEPFTTLKTGYHEMPSGRTQVNRNSLNECIEAINDLVAKL